MKVFALAHMWRCGLNSFRFARIRSKDQWFSTVNEFLHVSLDSDYMSLLSTCRSRRVRLWTNRISRRIFYFICASPLFCIDLNFCVIDLCEIGRIKENKIGVHIVRTSLLYVVVKTVVVIGSQERWS